MSEYLLFNGIGERRSLLGHFIVPSPSFFPITTPNVHSDVVSKSLTSSRSLDGLLDGSGGHIHAHQFEGLGLLRQGFGYVLVGLAYEVAHFALAEHSGGVCLPHGGDGGVSAAHLSLEVFVADLLTKVAGENNREVSVSETHAAESALERDISILTDQVLNG